MLIKKEIEKFCLGLILTSILLGCAGRDLHSDLFADPLVLVRQWTRATKTQWKAGERGAEFSNPVFFENTLIFGNQSEGVMSIYPGLNQVRWKLKIKNGVMSPLLVAKEMVFFGGGDGFLYGVSARTGRVQWKYLIRNPIVSRPTYDSGRLFVTTSDDTIYALDAGTGEWLWHYRRRSQSGATVLGASQPLVHANEVIVGLSDGYLVGISVQSGKLKWEKKIHRGQKFMDIDARPLYSEGILYVPSYDGALYAIDRKTKKINWRVDSGGSKSVFLEKGKIYFPSSDGFIYCLDKISGKKLWNFELDRGIPTALVVTPKYLIFGSSHEYLYVLNKENGKGVYRWQVGAQSGFNGTPVYDQNNGRIYFLSNAGNLYAFSLTYIPGRDRPRGRTYPYHFYEPI